MRTNLLYGKKDEVLLEIFHSLRATNRDNMSDDAKSEALLAAAKSVDKAIDLERAGKNGMAFIWFATWKGRLNAADLGGTISLSNRARFKKKIKCDFVDMDSFVYNNDLIGEVGLSVENKLDEILEVLGEVVRDKTDATIIKGKIDGLSDVQLGVLLGMTKQGVQKRRKEMKDIFKKIWSGRRIV